MTLPEAIAARWEEVFGRVAGRRARVGRVEAAEVDADLEGLDGLLLTGGDALRSHPRADLPFALVSTGASLLAAL